MNTNVTRPLSYIFVLPKYLGISTNSPNLWNKGTYPSITYGKKMMEFVNFFPWFLGMRPVLVARVQNCKLCLKLCELQQEVLWERWHNQCRGGGWYFILCKSHKEKKSKLRKEQFGTMHCCKIHSRKKEIKMQKKYFYHSKEEKTIDDFILT